MNTREQKALMIAAKSRVTKKDDTWLVPSQSGNGQYIVDGELQNCTCPDYVTRQLPCKHMFAVEYVIQRERSVTQTVTADSTTTTVTETETVKLRYNQIWPAYNSAQVNEKARFLALLYELCAGIDEPIQTMGRPRLTMADMIFASAYKVYSTVSSRRFMTDLKDACARRYIARVPHYNSIIGYLEKEELTPYLKRLITESSLPLKAIESDFAVDASGLNFFVGALQVWQFILSFSCSNTILLKCLSIVKGNHCGIGRKDKKTFAAKPLQPCMFALWLLMQ